MEDRWAQRGGVSTKEKGEHKGEGWALPSA